MTPQKSDVLIIGGGFMGASSAFFCASTAVRSPCWSATRSANTPAA